MFLGLLEVIGSGLAIVRSMVDPDKKVTNFNLAIRKNTKKALDTAEDIFDLVDEFVAGELKPRSLRVFLKQYKKLRGRFNDLD